MIIYGECHTNVLTIIIKVNSVVGYTQQTKQRNALHVCMN